MQRLTMPASLQKNMVLVSDYCQEHTYRKNGGDVVKPIQKMMIDGKTVCPRCEVEKETAAISKSESDRFHEIERLKNYNVLYDKSILSDVTILTATFENYTAEGKEQIENKSAMLMYLEQLKEGAVFNIILQGNQGVGKSHLAYALLQELNNHDRDETPKKTCLFVNVYDMMETIKNSFRNKESQYTEFYFKELLSSVDYLVLDDLGAETGAIDTNKVASDFVHRVLYGVSTARQGKVTITTFNLSSQKLFSMYDRKTISRILRNPRSVVFKETKDKRMEQLGF